MRIVIAGGHGQIALRLERLLAARGDEVAGIIRHAPQGDDLREAGAEPILLDLESASVEEVAAHLRGDRLAGALSLAYSRIVVHRGRVVARTSAVREYCNSESAATELGLPRQGRRKLS